MFHGVHAWRAGLRYLDSTAASSQPVRRGVEATAAMLGALPYGDPQDPGVMTGPIVNKAQLERIEGLVDRAVAAGARVVVGGGRPAQFEKGYYYKPTLLADVTNDMEIAQVEIFGPVLVAIAFDDDNDAVRIANDSPYGLSGAVMSDDRERACGWSPHPHWNHVDKWWFLVRRRCSLRRLQAVWPWS